METNINKSWSHAIAVGDEDLKGIIHFLAEQYEPIQIEANCTEGVNGRVPERKCEKRPLSVAYSKRPFLHKIITPIPKTHPRN